MLKSIDVVLASCGSLRSLLISFLGYANLNFSSITSTGFENSLSMETFSANIYWICWLMFSFVLRNEMHLPFSFVENYLMHAENFMTFFFSIIISLFPKRVSPCSTSLWGVLNFWLPYKYCKLKVFIYPNLQALIQSVSICARLVKIIKFTFISCICTRFYFFNAPKRDSVC